MGFEDRYLEISKHELEREDGKFLVYLYKEFRDNVPMDTSLGDNLIIMWASDYHRLRHKAEKDDPNRKVS